MSTPRKYRYDLGFAINGIAIPDPKKYTHIVASVDTFAERDLNGTLHRNQVAKKNSVEMNYTVIGLDVSAQIIDLLEEESVTFTFPSTKTGSLVTMRAYSGNRSAAAVWMPGDRGASEHYTDLSFTVIEF